MLEVLLLLPLLQCPERAGFLCRAYKILKPWSHLTIKVKQLPQDKKEDTTLSVPAEA